MRRTVWLFGLCSLSLLLLVSSAGGAPGVLDPSFGASGLVTTQLAMQTAVANALVLQSDGKLVAVGKSQPSGGGAAQLALVRYRPDGTLDSSFGSGGIVQTPIANGGGAAEAALQQPDKKILVAGTSSTSAGRMFMLARYPQNGSPRPQLCGRGGRPTPRTWRRALQG